jgi:tetratricopeptide (TPR) repeat protein
MSSTRRNRFLIDDAVARLKAGELTPALATLWTIVPTLEPEPTGEDRFWLVNTLYHLGLAFDREQVYDKAEEIFVDCLNRFGDVTDQDTADLLNMVATGAGSSAARANRFEEAIQYLDQAAERLKDASSITDRRALVDALVSRAAVVRKLEKDEDTVAAYSLVYDRFSDDEDPEICRNLALVLDEKAKVLKNAGLEERADEAARFFISQFEASWDPVIITRVIDAVSRLPEDKRPEYVAGAAEETRNARRARLLILIGTQLMDQNDIESALQQFDGAIQLLANEPGEENLFWQAQAIHNRGVAFQRSQRNVEAVAAFNEVYKRFQLEPADQFRKLVNSALINAAVCAIGVQLFDGALVYIDLAIQRLRDATRMADRQSLANAMYNRATILRMAGRTEDAVQAFDAVCERFKQDDDPKVYRFVGMAYYNKATTLSEANLIDRSTAAFETMAQECGNAQDPFVRERAARSVLAIAGNQLQSGDAQGHANTMATLMAMYGSDPEPAIQRVIGQALLNFPPLIIRLPPASHERNSPYNRQMYASLVNDFRDRPEILERNLNDYKEFLDRAADIDANEHGQAVAIVEEFWTRNKPFALFLRNFDRESSNFEMPMGVEFPMRAALILPGYQEVEEQIKATVGKQIPIISISNPSPGIHSKALIPKLEVNNSLWESALQALIHSAGMIVMMLDDATSGVSKELEAIVRQNRASATVLIVAPSVEEKWPLIAELRKVQLAGGIEPEEPTLPRFAVVVSSDELPSNDGQPLPEILKLTDRLGFSGSAGMAPAGGA